MGNQPNFSLAHLSDRELLSSVGSVVGSHRKVTVVLIAHLAEMDARKLYLSQATSSLFGYCVERLGFSEDEAFRRIEAARLARRFPQIWSKLERGEVSLSVLGKLKPVITSENASELLEAVSGKTLRDADRALAARFPKPNVADTIRKLPNRAAQNSCPALPIEPETPVVPPPATPTSARKGRVTPLSSDRFEIRFTASRALEEKLTLARNLTSHSNPSGDLATLIEAALELLIADRMQKKFGKTKNPRKRRSRPKRDHVSNETRREVVARDGLQCTFVDAEGRRCSERAFLELDHAHSKALGGGSEPDNVRVLCRAHNQGEADRVFGRDYIERKKRQRKLEVRDASSPRYTRGFPGRKNSPAATRAPRTECDSLNCGRHAPLILARGDASFLLGLCAPRM